jgi:hypothetical protein
MHLSIRPLVVAAIITGVKWPAQAQETAGPAANLSAREIFYLADETPAAAAKPHKTSHSKATATSAQPQQTAEARDTRDSSAQESIGQVRLATVTNRQYPPLGMRYAVYRLADGEKQAVAADTVFHSNDHIQFTIDVSAQGYLYVVSRGASGKWSTLFPPADSGSADNVVQPHQTYTFPPGQMITFAEPAGKEEVFIFLSRQPVRSTEDLMLQMSHGNKSAPAAQQAPDQRQRPNVIEAFNRMDDSQIGLLQTAYARDLIVEKVNTEGPTAVAPVAQAPVKDTSVYVVNPSAGADAHVVADVTFQHE